ncbi:MAG TPA: hypothetical protein VM869_20480, partial [Enhygromyxa sp.]|nr:hypothetical protein [Enhygromyxa sp.]
MRSRAVIPTFLLLLCATACAPTSTPTSASSSSPARTTRADPVEPAAKPTAPKPTAPKPTKDPFAAAFVEAHD